MNNKCVFISTDFTIFKRGNDIFVPLKYYYILKRYFDNFGEIILCSRINNSFEIQKDFVNVTSFLNYVVEVKNLYNVLLGKYDKDIKDGIKKCCLVVCRCPGIIANRVASIAKRNKIDYFSEVMGCAWDAFWNHWFLGKIFAPYMFLKTRKTIRNSTYVLYVTSSFLQKRYPSNVKYVSASNVMIRNINDDILLRRYEHIDNSIQSRIAIATTAAVNVRYKGQEYVIKAIPHLNKLGIKVKYYLIGEGDNTFLKRLSKKLGVEDQVFFCGRLKLDEIFSILDDCDYYIQPSLQEGLPRALIEAMSRGCICFGSKTGGIPELIGEDCIFKRKSHKAISKIIYDSFKSDLKEIANVNFNKSKIYEEQLLNQKRNDYFEYVRDKLVEKEVMYDK